MRIILPLGVAVCILLVLEIVGRWLVPATWPAPLFREVEKPPGFALRENFVAHYGRFQITIDSTGRRVVASTGHAPQAREVDVVGAAQVFGLGLDDAATIPSRLQMLLGPPYRVVNDGVPGYGPFAYKERALSLPLGDITIVLLSEDDDLRSAFRASSLGLVHCGYLVELRSGSRLLPCPLLTSGIARSVGYLHALAAQDASPVPLDYDPSSIFAARVLANRVHRLLDVCKRRLGAHLIVAYVPWDGAIEVSHRARYSPPLADGAASVGFLDEAGVSNALRDATGERFQDDGRLNAFGADIAARALASEVRRRSLLLQNEDRRKLHR